MYTEVEECVATGRRLLASGNHRDLRYAALEVRMAIEGLFYVLLSHYREELPDDITRTWQPRQLIDEIIRCNPFAQMHQQVTITAIDDSGEHKFVGTYRPVSRELLRKYYHRLGSYLHAAIEGTPLNERKVTATVNGALDRVEEHCRDTTVIANAGQYLTVACQCGREIKRNILATATVRHVRCPDPGCAAIYDLLAIVPPMQATWKLRTQPFHCEECQQETAIGVHRIRAGTHVLCEHCKAEYVLRDVLLGERVTSTSASGSA